MKSGRLHPGAEAAVPHGGGKRFISEWLDGVKEGYGQRFADAFEQVGVEDTEDLRELQGEEASAALDRALEAAGAKAVQLQKLRRAIAEASAARASQPEGGAPRPSTAVVPNGVAGHGDAVEQLAAPTKVHLAPKGAAKRPTKAAGEQLHAELWRSVFGARLPCRPAVIPRPGSVSPPSAAGYAKLQQGDGPRLYCVHGIDGEIFLAGSTFAAMSRYLGNCTCVALEYNDDARACSSVPALASLYVRRVMQDMQQGPRTRAYIVGYSFGCILAHQMALQLQHAGSKVGLVLIGSEVTWPSPGLPGRMGGYPWLGGACEAALHVARSYGGYAFAEQEVHSLLRSEAEDRHVGRLHMRTYWKVAGPCDMPYEDFMHTVTAGARNMDLMHEIMHDFSPEGVFDGPALLVLAPESPEFEVAEDVDRGFCSSLRVAFGLGSHYSLLGARNAHTVASVLATFLRGQGETVVFSTSPPPELPQQAHLVEAPPAVAPPPIAAPRASLEEVASRVLALLRDQVLEPLTQSSNMLEAGMDSISMSLVATQLQRDFGVQLTAASMMELETVGDLVRHIVGATAPQPNGAGHAAAHAAPAAAVARLPETPGLVTLQGGDGPRIYMVHGIDGDMFNSGASYAAVAPMLAPCHCAAMLYDEEAYRAETLPALAEVYNRRVAADSQRHPQCSVFVAGYSFGCVIAHQMALQLQARGVSVGLILVDFEVTYPPAMSMTRLGGYDWLGGDVEATLLLCRSMVGLEGIQWAENETKMLLEQKREERDIPGLQARAYELIAPRRRGFRMEDLQAFSDKGGRNMDRLHTGTGQWAPGGVFLGETLLILAPDSSEFHEAKEVNAKYCSKMEVRHALGTHYSILQPALAPKAAGCILNFLCRLGHSVPEAPTVLDVPGLVTMSAGEGPRVYMVHGIDGDIFSVGSSYAALAPMLAPCNACAFAYDEEAHKCDSVPALAGLYLWRVFQDMQRHPAAPIFFVGYSFGCVIAHQMALQAQASGVQVGLVLVDFEVTYPSGGSLQRLGGYDWLGGEVEATLLVTRSVGGIEGTAWAAQETSRLLALPAAQRDVDAVRRRAFDEVISKRRGFRAQEFGVFVEKGGRNMERIHTVTGKWAPSGAFDGETLLVLAPDSAEFHAAKEVNGKYCSKMQVVYALGTHYSILQAALAPKAAGHVLDFMRRLGHDVPEAPAVADVPGTATLRAGDGPRLYLVHGADGDAMGAGSAYAALAPLLGACHVCALAYDEEAFRCDSLPSLAGAYGARMFQDMQRNLSAPTVIVGYSFGCAIAHQMALQAQEMGGKVALVLIGAEVSYPPGKSMERLGGYDWLGGEIEAALMMVRSLGAIDWATSAAERLLQVAAAQRDAKDLRRRAFAEVVAKRGGPDAGDFERFCERGGRCADRLHSIVGKWEPPGVFRGDALLLLPPDSRDCRGAAEVNAKYCSSLQVVEGSGAHYTMLQEGKAAATAGAVLDFVSKLGSQVPTALGVDAAAE